MVDLPHCIGDTCLSVLSGKGRKEREGKGRKGKGKGKVRQGEVEREGKA